MRSLGLALCVPLMLVACGGAEPPADAAARGFAAAVAVAGPERARVLAATGAAPVAIGADDWFAWVERSFPETFPSGPRTQTVDYANRLYLVRHYPQQDVYLGVTEDGHVHAMGPFTNWQVAQYGQLANYACIIDPGGCPDFAVDTVSIWAWAGTQQCQPNDFPARLAALREQLVAMRFTVSGGQCARTMEFGTPAVCGALDGRMVVFDVPSSELPRALAAGWRPFNDGVNGSLNRPGLPACEAG